VLSEEHEQLDEQSAVSKKQRRDQLLDAAVSAILKYGMATSMDQIAAEANITKPILYRHFKDRAGLLAALERRYEDILVTKLVNALSAYPITSSHNAKALLWSTIECYVNFVYENLEIYRFLTRQELTEREIDRLELPRRISTLVASVIHDALDRNKVDPTPATLWAYGIVGMIHLAADWWIDHQEITKEKTVEELSRLLWYGLKAVTLGDQAHRL
jgi:AcrR family transcriptional regulator